MKAKLYKNIDMVQIDIKTGVNVYQLPKNVDWAKETIEKIVLLAPTASIVSPIDGTTHVLTRSELADVYVDLYAGNEVEIATNMAAENIMHTNNYPVEVNSTLQLDLCRFTFMQEPQADACMLLYVFYGTEEVEDYEPSSRSVTISFSLDANQKMSFREIINTYMHADNKDVRGISVWYPETNPIYMNLQDHNLTHTMRDIYGSLCRPQMLGATAEETQIFPIRLKKSDIDFDNSYVREASGSAHTQVITFEY